MIRNLRSIFKTFDTNKDGQLSYEELKAGFRKYYKNKEIADTELGKLIQKIDLDKNNSIEYEEFLRVTVNLELLFTDQHLKIAFDFFDKDGSGKLSPEEIKSVLSNNSLDNEVILDLIREIDTNGDGMIEYNEFKKLMIKVINKNLDEK
jgi:calcium-dependent protein kinase